MENAIITVGNVRGYIDENGTAWLNAEDVVRGLGFTKTEEKLSTATGRKEVYESIRWARVNDYLKDFGYLKTVGKEDFIPENMFYRLAMKAKNETAEKFQAKVADEILPAIRKHGFYSTQATPTVDKDFALYKLIRDVGKTAETLQQYFDVSKGISLATATAMVEDIFKVDLSPIKKLIPAAEGEVGTLNPTQIGEKLGGISGRKVNDRLIQMGLQFKAGKEYRLTDEGKKYAEMMPYTNNGHGGYQVKWTPRIVTVLLESTVQ